MGTQDNSFELNLKKASVKLLFVLFSVLLFSSLPAWASDCLTEPEQIWTKTYDNGGSLDAPIGIVTDRDGNVYVGGMSNNLISSNFLVIKYDPAGNVLWNRLYNDMGRDMHPRGMAGDRNGNVYITGQSCAYNTAGDYICDVYLTIKYDSAGNIVWAKRDIGGRFIAVEEGGNNIFLADSTGVMSGSYFITKTDSAGNVIWSNTYNSGYPVCYLYGMAIDGNSNIYVTGRAFEDPGYAELYHPIFVKYGSTGNMVWTQNGLSTPYIEKIAADSNGNIYVTYSGNLAKYNADGNVLWTRTIGVFGSSMDVDASGNVYLAGLVTISEYGNNAVRSIKYDSSGSTAWTKLYDALNDVNGVGGVTVDESGNIYVAGNFFNYKGPISSNSNNDYDYLTIKYAPLPGITTETLPNGATGIPYSATLMAACGQQPYTWSIASGSLPGGLTLNNTTGEISGVPMTVGTFNFTAQVIGANSTTATKSLSIVVPDSIPPATASNVSGIMGTNGWYVSDVAISLSATDSGSGVKEIFYGIDGTETIVTGGTSSFVISADGSHDVSYFAKDNAGNSEAAHSLTIKIDKTPPAISITGIAEGAVYVPGAVPVPGYTAADALSGVESHSAFLSGRSADNGTVYTYRVDARDLAGNASSVSVTYTVAYGFSGFLEPVSLGKPFKLGSTIPVKFRLTDAQGNYVSTAVATITVQQFSGDDPIGDPIILSANGADSGDVFRYDAVDNLYIFNLGTKDLVQGTWQVRAALDDGSVRSTFIQLKKN